MRRLAVTQPAQPTLILLDLQAAESSFPAFTAPVLSAVLTRRMQMGAIHPAWLIGLAATATPDLDLEAQVAGCHQILHTPLSAEQHDHLRRLLRTPVLIPPANHARGAYQLAAERMLEMVRTTHIPIWTPDDVWLLLTLLTHYPLPRAKKERPHGKPRAKQVVRALGGVYAARVRLQAISEAWRMRFPLHAHILRLFLAGKTRREIVHHFVQQGLYEDSRVYACINDLPERIAVELGIDPIDVDDA
jgi:hypothetical protein